MMGNKLITVTVLLIGMASAIIARSYTSGVDYEGWVGKCSECKISVNEPRLEEFQRYRLLTRQNGTSVATFAAPGIPSPALINQYFQDALPAYFKIMHDCMENTLLVRTLIDRIRQGGSQKEVETLMTNICSISKYNQVVCAGLAKRFAPTVYFIVKGRPDLTPEISVATVYQSTGCTTSSRYNDWTIPRAEKNNVANNSSEEQLTISVESSTPRRRHPKTSVSTEQVSIKTERKPPQFTRTRSISGIRPPVWNNFFKDTGSRPLKIVHLTDIHVDLKYEVGSNAACSNKILCCHKTDGNPRDPSVSAGLWGHPGKCDTPLITLESALKHIRETHSDTDLFYMSGDLIPHNMWYTTREENTKTIVMLTETIRNYLPNATIIPIFGNHEPHPVNMISPPEAPPLTNTRWILNVTYQSWLNWIPASSAEEYMNNGHYSVRLSDKFRILVFNSNVCFGFNLWQLYRINESRDQLLWLRDELEKSKASKELVHIVGHVPPGYMGCAKVFSRNYYHLVARYSSIIRAQFFGHLHSDTFKVYYSPNDKSLPIASQWISPSLTPYRTNNPAYKVFYVDPSSMDVTDYETYVLNLEKVNSEIILEPEWYRFYSASEAYGIPDVRLPNLASLVSKMAKNEDLFLKYYRYMKKAVYARQAKTCQTYCRKRILCRIVQPYFQADKECNLIQLQVDGGVIPLYDQYSDEV